MFIDPLLESRLNKFSDQLSLIAINHEMNMNELFTHFNFIAKGSKVSYFVLKHDNEQLIEDCIKLFHEYFPVKK